MKKQLKDLNLIDDYLFFTLLNDEVVGEQFGRKLLEIIFNRKFEKLKIVPQKVYYGADTDKHGLRLDVYIEEEIDSETLLKNSSIFDLEVESEKKKGSMDELPQRIRFYHAKIDAGSLGSGQDYRVLKKVIVVMIMPFDPFGYDHMVYTIQNKCLEVPELPYDDGAKTLFLYTKGTQGNPREALRELLQYMSDSQEKNVKNADLESIHNMVNAMKKNAEVAIGFMKIFEKERLIREEGKIWGVVKICREFQLSEDKIIEKLMKDYHLTRDEAEEACRNLE